MDKPTDPSAPRAVEFTIDETAPVLIAPASVAGLRDVALDPAEVAERTAEALDRAMGTVHNMARRMLAVKDALAERPTRLEFAFGLTLDGEAGVAFLAKAGVEATLSVTLGWEHTS